MKSDYSSKTLVKSIKDFMEKHEMSATMFGARSVGDNHLLKDLESGKTITLKRAERIQNFIRGFVE